MSASYYLPKAAQERRNAGAISIGRKDPEAKWQRIIVFLTIGYILFNRSFAYLGFPPLKLFIGEIVLFCLLVFRRRQSIDRLGAALSSPGRLRDIGWAMVVFIVYGLFEVCRGFALGYPPVTILENFAFNYYPLYLLAGWWLGGRNPQLLRSIVIRLAWLNGIYGVLFIVFLSRVPIFIPGIQGDSAAVFGQPWGAALSLLGLLCYERRLERVAVPLLLNSFVLLGMQVRAEWIGFLAGLLVYAVLLRQMKRVIVGAGVVCALLIAGYALNITLPGSGSRAGGLISTREIAARAVAPFSPETAREWTGNAKTYEETATWRTNWWKAIWASVHEDADTAAIGHGYGFPIVDLVPYLKGRYWLRTPHSVFFYALAYGGWIHVLLLAFLEAAIAAMLWQAFRITGQAYGLVAWSVINAWVFFDSAFESPFRAIPFFLICGMAMAPAVKEELERGVAVVSGGWQRKIKTHEHFARV
jgi:hypothetical protein